jgi:glutathione S-transferase
VSTPLTLYYRPGTCALSPHIVLLWTGLEHDAVNASRRGDYVAINPNDAVPALLIEGEGVLTQCNAVLNYLAKRAERDDLLGGPSHRGQAEVDQWNAFFTGDFHPAFYAFFAPKRYTTTRDKQAQAETSAAGAALVRSGLDTLEAHLSTRTYMVGEALTTADAFAFPMLRWVAFVVPSGRAEWPSVQAYYERVSADPGVLAAMGVHGIEA